MKKNAEGKIRSKKVSIVLMEYIVVLGCLLVAFVMISGKKIEQTNSYAKPEEVSRYEVVEDEYLTRVRPLTEYSTFKEIAENSLNKIVTVYTNETKTEEVVDGVITSGMVVEAEEEGEVAVPTQNRTYEVRVIGDLTGNGDCNVTELTRIIRHIVGIERFSKRGEEISADFSGEDVINVVDITKCINYIVYGKMDPDEEEVKEPKIEVKEIGEEEERDNNWYNGDVEVRIVEQGEGISKIQTIVEREGNKERTEEREIELTEEGRYKISSQSYGENGTKSRVVEKEINIDKTIPELEISREDVDMTQCKIIIRARDNGGIRKYSIQREGEEERSKEGIDQKELNGYVTIRENGKYKIVIEDKAGNKVEEEIEITDLNNRYTVIFKNEDGSIISERDYDQGATVEVPQNPSKAEDNTYTYEFTGWSPQVEETVTENKEYTATFTSTYKNYTVTFKDEDGTVISTKNNYHYGDIVTVPENPTKQEDDTNTYRFIGWDKEVSTEVVGNVEYKAVYEATRKGYTITFKDENGEILSSKTDYQYGERIAVPQNPSKAEDNTYTYEFTGWNPQIQETVTENKEYTATYRATYKNYTVTFKDEDGTIITTKNDYHYGDTVAVPENPTKPDDDTYTYRFIGWDKEVSTVVEGNVEYKAVYEATRKEYTITFKDEDGTVLSNKTDYHYGERIAVPQNPSKAEDNTYTYEFTGWNPQVEETVTENKEYTATYRATYKNYTVTFKDEDGTIITTKNDYHYGDTVAVPENPSKAEDNTNTYEFVGWNQEVQETVIENKEYIATYREAYKNYTVSFKDEDGTVLTSKSDYHYGDTVAVPQNPSKQEDETYTYEFIGWSPEVLGTVIGNKEYSATYRAIYKNYTVTFKDENGTVISTKNDYHYGDTVTIPENPTKPEDDTYTYRFIGWDKEVSTVVEGNVEYKAVYEATRKEYTITFKDEDGTVLTSKSDYHYGETVAIPQNPSKQEDETYTYEFIGWSPEVQGTVIGNKEYSATYRAIYKNYTVTFKDEDGTVITTKNDYHYGDTVAVPQNPTKVEDNTYTYEFKGWAPEIVITEEEPELKVTENKEYTALYETKFKEYTVVFRNEDGEIINSTKYHYGDEVNVPENPRKESTIENAYKFIGWNKEIEQIVTKNEEYIAQYEEEIIKYNLNFYNDDNTYIETRTYIAGETISFPTATKEADEGHIYIFDSWVIVESKEVTEAQIDIKFKAQYKGQSYVARLEGTETYDGEVYLSIEEAIRAAEDKRTITMLQNVDESIVIEDNQDIVLNLNGKRLTGNRYYTINNYGKLFIIDDSNDKGGIIENNNDIAIRNNGELIIGEDDGEIVNELTIKGKNTAIENNKIFYMYDDTLIAEISTVTGNSPIIPQDDDLEYGLSIQEIDGLKIATIQAIVIPEALVGDKYYLSLQDAINENNNTTITVAKKNVKLRESLIVDETKNLTIDLNGNTITQTNKSSSEYVLKNSGTLTIMNSNENIESNIINEKGIGLNNTNELIVTGINVNTSNTGISNTKDLNVENVNIESTNGYGIFNNIQETNDINFYMNNGNIKAGTGINNSYSYPITETNTNANININNINIEARSRGIYNSANNITEELNNVDIKVSSSSNQDMGIEFRGNNSKFTINNSNINVISPNGNKIDGIWISNCSEVNINNSIITAEKGYGIYISSSNIININNSIIKTKNSSFSIYTSTSVNNLILDQGTQIICENNSYNSYGIYFQNANLQDVISSKVKLLDANIKVNKGYGIFLEHGSLDFLGGSISGTVQTIKGNIDKIQEGKEIKTIQNEEGVYFSTLVDKSETEYVAEIGEEKYYNLEDALLDCKNQEDSKTIKLISDYEQQQGLNITEDEKVVLDLNGHTLVTKGSINNEGNLEITDSDSNKQGQIKPQGTIGIINKGNGTFKLSDGKILFVNNGLGVRAIYNMDNANLQITGGTIEINSSGEIIYNISIGNVDISGGELIGKSGETGEISGVYNYVNDIESTRNVNITGGSMELSSNNSNIYGIYNYATTSEEAAEISDNKINLNVDNYNININGRQYCDDFYGIYNYIVYGKNTAITVNIGNSNINMINNSMWTTKNEGIYNYVSDYYDGRRYRDKNSISIYNNIESGNINVKGQNKGEKYGIENKSKYIEINLGKENSEENDELNILGDTVGIYDDYSNKINYYDGVIKGTQAISDKTALTLEENKEINRYIDEEDGYDTINLKERTPQAKIGETTYMTIQEAIDACEDGAEEYTKIELLRNIENSTNTITIGKNKKITLDLKGNNINSVAESAILNNGELKIIDSIEEGSINNTVNTTIYNQGNLEINNINVYGKKYGIYNNLNNIILKNSKIDSKECGIRNFGNMTIDTCKLIMEKANYGINNSGKLDILNCEISVKNSSSVCAVCHNSSKFEMNIKNSNIKIIYTGSQIVENMYFYAINAYTGNVSIGEKNSTEIDSSKITSTMVGVYGKINYYGGIIEGEERAIQGSINDTPDNKTICVEDEDKKISLIDKEEKIVAKIGNNEFTSLAKAVQSVEENKEEYTEIQLVDNSEISTIEEEVNIAENQKIKIDLNSKTITSYRNTIINNNGQLEILDSSELKEGKLISVFNTGIENRGELILNDIKIKALRYGIYNPTSNGNMILNNTTIVIDANDRSSSAGIYSYR